MMLAFKSALVALTLLALVCVAVSIPLPYKNCGKNGDHITIDSGEADIWPPHSGVNVTMTLQGKLDEVVTDGEWDICIFYFGIKVLCDSGPLIDLNITLPAQPGNITITNVAVFPSGMVAGNYRVDLSAKDQKKEELFCTSITFTIREEDAANISPFLAVHSVREQAFTSFLPIARSKSVRNPRIAVHA